jgi:hypothetical protein
MGKDSSIDANAIRSRIISELLDNLAESRRIMLDQNMDLKTRERWSQIHMSTSQTLNTVLRDLQTRDWEERLKNLEESGKLNGTVLRTIKTRATN